MYLSIYPISLFIDGWIDGIPCSEDIRPPPSPLSGLPCASQSDLLHIGSSDDSDQVQHVQFPAGYGEKFSTVCGHRGYVICDTPQLLTSMTSCETRGQVAK